MQLLSVQSKHIESVARLAINRKPSNRNRSYYQVIWNMSLFPHVFTMAAMLMHTGI